MVNVRHLFVQKWSISNSLSQYELCLHAITPGQCSLSAAKSQERVPASVQIKPQAMATICPSLIIGEHMLMQPLCSLHVLLLSQGQNWIAPGYCILPYAWLFGYIMRPHVCLLFISSCALVWKYSWIKKKKMQLNLSDFSVSLFMPSKLPKNIPKWNQDTGHYIKKVMADNVTKIVVLLMVDLHFSLLSQPEVFRWP